MITASITASFSSSDRSALALELARDAFLAHDFKRSDDETAVLLVCVKAHLDIPLGAKSGGYSDSFMPPIKHQVLDPHQPGPDPWLCRTPHHLITRFLITERAEYP
jgi:hypothetical protein